MRDGVTEGTPARPYAQPHRGRNEYPVRVPIADTFAAGGGRRTQRRSTEERTEEHGVVHHRAVSQDELVAGSRHYGQD